MRDILSVPPLSKAISADPVFFFTGDPVTDLRQQRSESKESKKENGGRRKRRKEAWSGCRRKKNLWDW